MVRIPHCLDSRLTDGGEVVSPTHPPHLTPQKHYYLYASGTEGAGTPGPSETGRITQIKFV
jgi:hypothetical protein